jgi:hypothetical protein
MATVGVDVNYNGKADYFISGVDLNHDGIPDSLQGPGSRYSTTVPITSSRNVITSSPVVLSAPIATTSTTVIPYREQSIIPYKEKVYETPMYKEMPLTYYRGGHSFTHDVWVEILRPLGLGIALPVGGAAAFIGGTVVGGVTFAGGCVFGLFSTVRGVFGIFQVGADYIVAPMSHFFGGLARPMDQMEAKMLGDKVEVIEDDYWWWPFGGKERVILEQDRYIAPPTSRFTELPGSRKTTIF